MTQQTGRQFMHGTRYELLDPSGQQKGLPAPPLQLPPDPAWRVIDLPAPADAPAEKLILRELIEQRRSLRDYTDQPLGLAELSCLLWCTQGVVKVVGGAATLRTVPSAGARHAFETIVLANRVEGLDAGLYRYLAIDHQLAALPAGKDIADVLTAACFGQDFVRTSAATFIWTAVVYRMTWRYGERGYRYLHLDAGHVCQNLYLVAESLGCGACAIAAFDDDAVNAALGLDGAEQFAIYLATVGKRP